MTDFVIIKVGNTHHGDLVPGMLLTIKAEDCSIDRSTGQCYFPNPLTDRGISGGKVVKYITLEEGDFEE